MLNCVGNLIKVIEVFQVHVFFSKTDFVCFDLPEITYIFHVPNLYVSMLGEVTSEASDSMESESHSNAKCFAL